MMRVFLMACACAFVSFQSLAQDAYKNKIETYIEQYKDIAMAEMQRSGVPASITLAQGILESGCGESELAAKGNNHFGIKCHNGWEGKTMHYDDDAKDECFRCYTNPEESFRDHSDFLRTRERYAFLFDYHPTDYKKWAHGLKQAGYATNPKYPELLIDNIERYNLGQYDIYDSFLADNATKPSHTKSPASSNPRKERKTLRDFFAGFGQPKPVSPNASASIIYVNNLKAVHVKEGQTIESIAKSYGTGIDRLLKYNDLNTVQPLTAGSVLFLQPKRRLGDSMYHVVKATETMYAISQQHGVKLQYLYTRNQLMFGEEPAVNEVIYLKDKRATKPLLRGQEPKPVTTEPSAALAAIGSRSAATPAAEDGSPKYAKPMPTDPLFKSYTEEKSNASLPIEAAEQTESDYIPPVDNTATVTNEKGYSEQATADYITTHETEGTDYHTVKPKETLYGIAKLYGLTVDELMEINQLGSNVISSGMRLRVKP